MENYDPLLTLAALNMAIVSLHRITSTRDRVILDQEYKNIINNLRMGEINADSELTELYQEIVRVINRGRLRDDFRKSIDDANSQEKQKNIKDIIAKKAFSSFDINPLNWLGRLAMSCASEYFGFRKKVQLLDEQAKLQSEELGEYDELQRKLLASSWALLRKYQLSDDYRLTQNALEKFYSATQENDSAKRLRMLKYLENEFSMYSPYWFYRAIAAQNANEQTEAEKSFAKFNDVWRPVLRKDPYKVEAMKFQIESLTSGNSANKNADKILECLSEMRANTELEDWANNIFAGTVYFLLGEKEKAIECVMCNIDFNFETDNSKMLLERFEGKKLAEKTEINYQKIEAVDKKSVETQKTLEAPQIPKEQEQSLLPQEPSVIETVTPLIPKGKIRYTLGYFCEKITSLLIIVYGCVALLSIGYLFWSLFSNGFWNTIEYAVVGIVIFVLGSFSTIYIEAKALSCYQKAAEDGYADAQYKMGCIYDKINEKSEPDKNLFSDVKEDHETALLWYQKAAAQGHRRALRQLKLEKKNKNLKGGHLYKIQY